MDTPIVYKDLSYTIIEACMEVHLGPGFTEKLYEEAVIREIAERSIAFERQKLIEVFYKGDKTGEYRLDIVVDNKIILELKAVAELNSTFEAQLFSYLRATTLN
jgi:GxxExxY protein